MSPSAANLTDVARARTTSLRQGDLIRAEALPLVTVPATSLHQDELGSFAGASLPIPVAVEPPTSLVAVVSCDCDLVRRIEVEPTFVVAPVLGLPDDVYWSARDGAGSSRVFSLPPLSQAMMRGEALHHCGIDARWLYTIEKTALLSPTFEVIPCPLEAPGRDRLRMWLGRRFGRAAFPDDIQRRVVQPLVDAIRNPRSARGEVERLRRAASWYGIRWADGSAVVSALIVLDPARRHAAALDATAARGAQAAIHARLQGRTGTYEVVRPAIADADQVSLLDAMSYRQFFIDPLDPAAGEAS